MKRFWLVAVGLLFLPLAGCAEENTPDEAMQTMATSLAGNKPQAYWDGLPASYQKDVEGLVGDFAQKMDPEIWNRGFAAAKNLVQLLDEKKEYIQQNPLLAHYVDAQVAADNWDDAVQALSILVKSDASDLNKLKTLDIKEFLSTTGADLMEHLPALVAVTKLKMLENIMQEYKTANFKLVEMEGNTATIAIEVPGKEPEIVPMVKVEEKWIPQEMADSWADDMQEARNALAEFNPGQDQAVKEQVLANIQMVDSYLKMLLDSKSADDFNGKVSAITLMLAMGGGAKGRASSPPPSTIDKSSDARPISSSQESESDVRLPGIHLPEDEVPADTSTKRASPAEFTTPAASAATDEKP